MYILEWVERVWAIVSAFLIAGGVWYWNNKKTKTGKRLDALEGDSKQLENLKTIVDIIQNEVQVEIDKKNKIINELSLVIVELNKKIEKLSSQIKELNNKLNDNSNVFESVEELAKGCNNRTAGQACAVLSHISNKGKKIDKNHDKEYIKYNKG